MLKKALCVVFLLLVIAFSVSCGKDVNESIDGTNETEKSTTDYIEDTSNKETDIKSDNEITYVIEAETNKHWDLQMFLDICKNYEMSCYGVDIQQEEQISFEKIFDYFALVGCTNTHLKQTRPEMSTYFDDETGKYVVPCEIVDGFLMRRFNTEVNRESIEYYDSDDNSYVFPAYVGEFYRDQELLITEFDYKNSIYTLDIASYESRDDSGLSIPLRRRYSIEIYDDFEYRFVSVQTLDPVSLFDSNSKKHITYNDGVVCVEEKSSPLNSTQAWWLVAVPNNDGVYTIRSVYDGTYGLCINEDSEIVMRKMRTWASVSNDQFAEFQFQIISENDNTLIIKSLSTNEYITINENGLALSTQEYVFSIENVPENQ